MKILCITDVHDNAGALQRILAAEPDADVVVLGGDLTTFGTPEDAARLLDLAAGHDGHLLAVAGNCDSPAIERLIAERGISVHGRGVEFGGAGFFGVSGMPPWMGNMYEFTEEEIHGHLERGHAEVAGLSPLVMVSHAPPRNSGVDMVRGRQAVGSTAVRDWIARTRPALVLTGHIHEARGQSLLDTTLVVNCGLGRDGYYAVAEVGEETRAELKTQT